MEKISSEVQVNELPKYLDIYTHLPLRSLEKIESTEKLISMLELLGGAITFYIFYLIIFAGIDAISPVVVINYPRWSSNVSNAYYLEWFTICLLLILIYLRKSSHNSAKLPLLQQDRLKKAQIYGDQKLIQAKYETIETTNSQKEKAFSSTSELRDPSKYNITATINIGIIILYLNYFPRKEGLFPSLIFISQETAVVVKPAEYSTFFMINIVFSFMIFTLFLFLLFYSIRQLKDMKKVVKYKLTQEIGTDEAEKEMYNWKPPLPKPWKNMTIQERKEYDLKVLKIQKERAAQVEKLKIALELKKDKDKLRFGEKEYKKKKKEEEIKQNTKQDMKAKKEEIIREKYDFR
jgi:hypothetical protein